MTSTNDTTSTNERLRVLHVLASLGPTNAQYHEHCLPLLGKRDFTVCSLLPAALTPDPRVRLVTGDGSRRGALRALSAALRSGEHDVVHAHVPASATALAMVVLARGDRRSLRRRCVFSLTNSYASYSRRNRLLLLPLFAFFPHLVLCSEAVEQSLPRPLRRLARGRSSVVVNGVDTERVGAVARASARAPHDGLTVAWVSRLMPIKDLPTVLRAFASASRPGDRLVVIGDGPTRGAAEEEIRRLGVERQVELAGLVPRDEVYGRLGEADVYVSASLGEGLPVAVLEAMAAGCPVILSDIPPHRELAEATGVIPLVAIGDWQGLAAEIERFRARSATERASIGHRCRGVADEHYGVAVMHAGLARVYEKVSRRNAGTVGVAS